MKGDSGAWVFQAGSKKIYGYVIATNGSRHAYMVILHKAMAEIQRSLGASGVSLANSTDPDLRLHPGMTHEPDERTHRRKDPLKTRGSIPVSGDDALIESTAFSDLQRQELPPVVTNSDDNKPEELAPVITSQKRILQMAPDGLESSHKLSKEYLEGGRVLEAIRILESVVQERTILLGYNHLKCLVSQHELAVAYIQKGRTKEAVRLLSRVVATEEGFLDKSDMSHLTTRHELGRAYLADGRAEEAIKILEHVVALKQTILDASNPNLLASQMVLAEANLRANRESDAISLFERVISAATATSSENERIRAHSLQWISLAHRKRDGRGIESYSGQNSGPFSIFIGSGGDRVLREDRALREVGSRIEERLPREDRSPREESVPIKVKVRARG